MINGQLRTVASEDDRKKWETRLMLWQCVRTNLDVNFTVLHEMLQMMRENAYKTKYFHPHCGIDSHNMIDLDQLFRLIFRYKQ